MTALQLYNAVLVEVNKVDAPNILLEDFNYLANKAINNYINKRYNIYDVNQQTTDDLRVLKASAILPVTRETKYDELGFMDATYEVILPSDYLHMLNCECIYKVNKTYKCYTPNKPARAKATRLTADLYSQVLDNFWNRPTYKKPYYYIHNINTNSTNPTNPIKYYNDNRKTLSWDEESNEWKEETVTDDVFFHGTDVLTKASDYEDSYGNNILEYKNNGEMPTHIDIKSGNQYFGGSNVERSAGVRYGNVSEVRMEIRYGTDYQSVFELQKVLIDYIKTPQQILLTQEQLDRVEDTSQMLEFPDYVCQEIVNELVHIVMELISDPRLQTHPVVNQSIANPVQQQTTQPAATTA